MSDQQQQDRTVISFADGPPTKQQQEKPPIALPRTSTNHSTATSDDGKSVRSVLMKRLKLVKRRKARERMEGPPYHTMDMDAVCGLLKGDVDHGLSENDIDNRRIAFNELEGEGGVNPVKLLLKQFLNLMVFILLAATVCLLYHLAEHVT